LPETQAQGAAFEEVQFFAQMTLDLRGLERLDLAIGLLEEQLHDFVEILRADLLAQSVNSFPIDQDFSPALTTDEFAKEKITGGLPDADDANLSTFTAH
jgi:hypothetical protein